MKRRKGLAVGVICLLMLLSIPTVVSNEEKPDLIIESIDYIEHGHHVPPNYYYSCKVKNIGEVASSGTIKLSVKINRLLFRYFPIGFGKIFEASVTKTLEPGQSVDIEFLQDYEQQRMLYFFGVSYFRFNVEVNPDEIIDESDTSNNYYSETKLLWFGRNY